MTPDHIGRHRPRSPHEIACAERRGFARAHEEHWFSDRYQPRHTASLPREDVR